MVQPPLSSSNRNDPSQLIRRRLTAVTVLVLVFSFAPVMGVLPVTAAPANKSSPDLPGSDVDIQHLDRTPPKIEKPYGLPEVNVPSEPETIEGIQQYEEALVSAQLKRMGNPRKYEPTLISSLEELSAYARASNVYVKMKPGTYEITRENYHDLVQGSRRDDGLKMVKIFRFLGSNSLYDLRGVEITFNARIFPDTGKPLKLNTEWSTHVSITGTNQVIRGLTYRIVDPDDRNVNFPANGVSTWHLGGKQNMMYGVTVKTDGSTPYGYGDLLGKGSTKLPNVRLGKVNGVGTKGVGNIQIGTRAVGRSFGHVFTWGGKEMALIDCDVRGQTRLTTDILQETSGPAYENDFKNVWTDETIEPGYMIALTEDAFRTYQDRISGKALNCTVDSTRSGVTVGHSWGDVFMSHMRITRITNKGYAIPPTATLRACTADIRYSPAIRLVRRNNVEAKIQILPSPTDERVKKHRRGLWLDDYYHLNPKMAAWINNKNHQITLTASEDLQLREDDPHYIVIGQPDDDGFWDLPNPAVNVQLRNETGLPVLLAEESRNCTVVTNGPVKDLGESNTVKRLKEKK